MSFAWEGNHMSSFHFRAIGCLARNPEVVAAEEGTYCRFCLTSQDYTEDDEWGHFTVTVQTVWFVATHLIGAAIAASAGKGDQLFVEGKIRKHHWTARGDQDTTLVVTGFRYGAKRNPGSPTAKTLDPTPVNPCQPDAAGAMVPTG